MGGVFCLVGVFVWLVGFFFLSALDACFACVGLLGVRVGHVFWRHCDIGGLWGIAQVRLFYLSQLQKSNLTWYCLSCNTDNAMVWWGSTMTAKLFTQQLPEDLLQSFRKQRLRNRPTAKLQWNCNKYSWLWLRVNFSSYLGIVHVKLLCIFKRPFFVLKPYYHGFIVVCLLF